MRRWSRGRAQTEPLAAIVAVFAVAVGLVTYSGLLSDTMPESERDLAPATLSEVRDAVGSNGVLFPSRLADGLEAKPAGYRLNLTLSTESRAWHAGPPAPPDADSAAAVVSVRLAPGDVRPSRLRVEVWR